MKDRRRYPANERVALKGFVDSGQKEVLRFPMQISKPVASLLDKPSGQRDRQLLMGDDFDVLEFSDGWAFGVSVKDDYVGYINQEHLSAPQSLTHVVSARATHVYSQESFKSAELYSLSFGSKLCVMRECQKYYELETGGFVPKKHLRPVEKKFNDPVTIAQLFFGTPYLWGGNSSFGIDCSGLVQAGMLACGIPFPADSDMQLECGHAVKGGYQRGDMLFWKGHIAICVDENVMIHANAHHMAVVYEPIEKALLRIKAQGDGDLLTHRRM